MPNELDSEVPCCSISAVEYFIVMGVEWNRIRSCNLLQLARWEFGSIYTTRPINHHRCRGSRCVRNTTAVTTEEDFNSVMAAFERQSIRFCLELEPVPREFYFVWANDVLRSL